MNRQVSPTLVATSSSSACISSDLLQKNKRVYIPTLRGDACVGDFVRYRRHCDGLGSEVQVGRLSKIEFDRDGPLLHLLQYIRPKQIPSRCNHSIPPLRHSDVEFCPEVVETDKKMEIQIREVISFAFVFPATEVTSPGSSFHPQGMVH